MSDFFISCDYEVEETMDRVTRPCARTLDRPVTLFGMEPAELAVVGSGAIAVMFLVDALPAVLFGVGGAVLLRRVKAGKPPGHLFYLLYRGGWVRYFPSSLRAEGLLCPPPPSAKGEICLCAGPSESGVDSRFYWSGHERLP